MPWRNYGDKRDSAKWLWYNKMSSRLFMKRKRIERKYCMAGHKPLTKAFKCWKNVQRRWIGELNSSSFHRCESKCEIFQQTGCQKEIGLKIATKLGRMMDIIIVEIGGKEGRHIKLLVEIDLTNHCREVQNWNLNKMGFRWISSEQLPDFCFNCGCIGHCEKRCCKRKLDASTNCLTYI